MVRSIIEQSRVEQNRIEYNMYNVHAHITCPDLDGSPEVEEGPGQDDVVVGGQQERYDHQADAGKFRGKNS